MLRFSGIACGHAVRLRGWGIPQRIPCQSFFPNAANAKAAKHDEAAGKPVRAEFLFAFPCRYIFCLGSGNQSLSTVALLKLRP